MIVGRPFAAAGDGFVEMGAGLGSGVAGFAGGVQLALADVVGRGAGIVEGVAAASDVLLDLLGAGFKDREAQRLLIEVNCEIGMREVAREKCALLGAVYRLDGQGSIAEDVERLALIL